LVGLATGVSATLFGDGVVDKMMIIVLAVS